MAALAMSVATRQSIFADRRDVGIERLNFDAAMIFEVDVIGESEIEETDKEEERSLISMRGWEFEHRCPGGGFQKQEAGTGAAPALPLDAKAPCADADAVKSSLCMATSIVFIVVAIASVALRLVRIDKRWGMPETKDTNMSPFGVISGIALGVTVTFAHPDRLGLSVATLGAYCHDDNKGASTGGTDAGSGSGWRLGQVGNGGGSDVESGMPQNRDINEKSMS
ncbi:hypothetical protein BJV77DRAFT_962504 [Russula vinacea]|nr:hypothetical protein BJV77DRAFT_962504 [Russula vinacea]